MEVRLPNCDQIGYYARQGCKCSIVVNDSVFGFYYVKLRAEVYTGKMGGYFGKVLTYSPYVTPDVYEPLLKFHVSEDYVDLRELIKEINRLWI